jgi:ABC-type multidrug transport system fused ATPase/permease subunit
VEKYQEGIYKRVFGYLKNQKLAFVIGVILTMALGGVYPVFSVFLSDIINALFDIGTVSKHDKGRSDANTASLVFLILAVGGFAITFARDMLTYIVGDEITTNIRR